MKKILLFAFTCIFITSCEQSDLLENNMSVSKSVSQESNFENVVEFSSKEDLAKVINSDGEPTRSTVCRFKIGEKFISMMDVIDPSYEHWNELSEEEKKCILEEKLTYYDALGYADLVPNENFAKLLNNKGEIIVDDSLYRITPIGTFCSDTLSYKDIDVCYNRLINSNDSIVCDGNGSIKLSPTVSFYNSFAAVNKSDFNYNLTRSGGCIPLKYCSSESGSWLARKIAIIFGDRSTKEYEYISKRRINASLYDYNYGVYYESGALVYTTKKRGGWFSWINGWKHIDADELNITCKNVEFKLDLHLPNPPQIPAKMTVVNNSCYVSTNLSDKKLKTVDILGYDIDYSLIAGAIKLGRDGLASLFKDNKIASDTKVVRFTTPTAMYITILDCSITKKNTDQIRKVFNSGVQFFVSSDMIKNPLSLQSAKSFFNGIMDIPVQHINKGRVIFTSKIDGQWGGIVIDKNYSGGTEYIYK